MKRRKRRKMRMKVGPSLRRGLTRMQGRRRPHWEAMTWMMTRITQTCPRAPSSAMMSRPMACLLAPASQRR